MAPQSFRLLAFAGAAACASALASPPADLVARGGLLPSDAVADATVGSARPVDAVTQAALEDPHAPFTSVLYRVRASLTNVTNDVEVVEQVAPGPARREADLRVHMQTALREIEVGIQSLRQVRRDVEASDRLSPPVKTQVLWDLDKMTEDVQRLHASGLAPNGRAALLKALQLRFAVLLSPSFWRAPIHRSLISR